MLTIWMIDSKATRLAELKRQVVDLTVFEMVEVGSASYFHPPPGLDVIFMTLPAAERWNPDFKARNAQIIPTSQKDQESGFPRLIVTGVNLKNARKDPISQVKVVLSSVLEVVKEYNSGHRDAIRTLGFWVMDLTRGLSVTQLGALLRDMSAAIE